MYCRNKSCGERIFKDYLVDENGYEWLWDVQLCRKCRPKNAMTKDEIDLYFGISSLGKKGIQEP